MTIRPTYSPLAEDHAEVLHSHRKAIGDIKAQMVSYGWISEAISPAHLAQEILDREIIPLDSIPYQEAVGVLIGDEIVSREGFIWITIEDGYGRDAVVSHPTRSAIIDPLSAVVKRFEQNEHCFDIEHFISEAVRVCSEEAVASKGEDLAGLWGAKGS